jgi:cellulase (glycosyl hydrolase family 5)
MLSYRNQKIKLTAILITVACMFTAFSYAGEPIKLHPDNPHYFEFRGEPTILITSAEHYGAVLNLDFDYIPYLDTLQETGMNLTRTFSGVYCEKPGEFKIEKNTLAPADGRLIAPWARSSKPGYTRGGNKFDLTKWDKDYFKRLKDFIRQAGKRGVVVELVFFCPNYNDGLWTLSPTNAINNINGYSKVSSKEVYTLKDEQLTKAQDAMVRKIVSELEGFDNLFYEICNEPYFGGVTLEWQSHIAQVITDTESSFKNKHLIAQNIANSSKVIENADPNVSIFNFHYAYPPVAVAQNFKLDRVIGYDESGFKGSGDTKYRGDAWAFILAGGGEFNNLDYSFTTECEDGTASQNAPGGGSQALRTQLNILQDFMHTFNFIRMKPDPSIITSIKGKNKPKAWALAREGKEYALYIQKGPQAQLRIKIPKGKYRAEWINTITGKIDHSVSINHTGGDVLLKSPDFTNDIALRIKQK